MMMDDRGVPGDCPYILDTEDLDSVTYGSRKPMQPFESPFLGMTDDEVRTWMSEHRNPNFVESTFAVLDGDTARNKTCRIGVTDVVLEDVDKVIRRISLGVCMSWCLSKRQPSAGSNTRSSI